MLTPNDLADAIADGTIHTDVALRLARGDYKADLTPAEEHHEPCSIHPHARAVMCDLDTWGRKVPLCEACWRERWPIIRLRLAAQRLVLGGVPL